MDAEDVGLLLSGSLSSIMELLEVVGMAEKRAGGDELKLKADAGALACGEATALNGGRSVRTKR